MNKLTMITSFYNGYDKFLNNWVLAILNGEVMPDEIVLVISGDDYDETNIDNARVLLNNKIDYQIIKIPHKCMGNARNEGVKIASNEWILYLNVDDTITENAIKDIKDNLNDDIDVLTGSMLWADHINKKTLQPETYIRKYQITRESIMTGGMTNDHSTYRKSLWEKSPYIEYSGDIDMAFWLGLVQVGARIKCIDNLLTAHYFRSDTVFGKYSKEDLREIKRMIAIWQKEGVHSDRFKSDDYKHNGDYNFKHKTSSIDLSIVVAFKNDGEFRNEHLNWTVSRYKLMFPDAEIIISEDTTSKDGTWNDFCKSKYINLGVARAKNNNILITDVDIVLDKNAILEGIKKLGNCCILPYNQLVKLNYGTSNRVLSENPTENLPNVNILKQQPIKVSKNKAQGIHLIRKSDFIRVGGYDERFIGWGSEDSAFQMACRTFLEKDIYQLNYNAYHFKHPIVKNRLKDRDERIGELLQQYKNALNNKDEMQKIIAER